MMSILSEFFHKPLKVVSVSQCMTYHKELYGVFCWHMPLSLYRWGEAVSVGHPFFSTVQDNWPYCEYNLIDLVDEGGACMAAQESLTGGGYEIFQHKKKKLKKRETTPKKLKMNDFKNQMY